MVAGNTAVSVVGTVGEGSNVCEMGATPAVVDDVTPAKAKDAGITAGKVLESAGGVC